MISATRIDICPDCVHYGTMGLPYNNEQLKQVAETTWGKNWRRPLALAMGVHHTQVMRWSSGKYEISDDQLARAKEACRRRAAEIMKEVRG